MAVRMYNIHWLADHFGLNGDGRDSAKHPHPTDPDETISINGGGTIFHDPTTGTTGGCWKFFGDYILKEQDEAKAFQEYMKLCQGMYSDLRFSRPKPPKYVKYLNIPWDREMRTPSDEDLEQLLGICTGFTSIEALKGFRDYSELNMVSYPADDGRMHTCFAFGRHDSHMELIRYDGEPLWDTNPNSFDNRTMALELYSSGRLSLVEPLSGTNPFMLVVGARDSIAATTAKLKESSNARILEVPNIDADLGSSFLEACKGHAVTIYTGHCSSYGDAGQRWLEQLQNAGVDAEIFMDQGDQTLHSYCTSGATICPDTLAKQKDSTPDKPTLRSDVDLKLLRKVIKVMTTHDGRAKVAQFQRNKWFKDAKAVKAFLDSLPEIFERVVKPSIDGRKGRRNIFYRLRDGYEAYIPESGSTAQKEDCTDTTQSEEVVWDEDTWLQLSLYLFNNYPILHHRIDGGVKSTPEVVKERKAMAWGFCRDVTDAGVQITPLEFMSKIGINNRWYIFGANHRETFLDGVQDNPEVTSTEKEAA